jgi:hypothetical protein
MTSLTADMFTSNSTCVPIPNIAGFNTVIANNSAILNFVGTTLDLATFPQVGTIMLPNQIACTSSNPYMSVLNKNYISTLFNNVYNINTNLKNSMVGSNVDDRTYPTRYAVQEYITSAIDVGGRIDNAIDAVIATAIATANTGGVIDQAVDAVILSALSADNVIDLAIDAVITTAIAEGGVIDDRIDTVILSAIAESGVIDNRIDTVITTAIAEGGVIDNRIDTVITTAIAEGGVIDNRIDTVILSAIAESGVIDNRIDALIAASATTGAVNKVNMFTLTTAQRCIIDLEYQTTVVRFDGTVTYDPNPDALSAGNIVAEPNTLVISLDTTQASIQNGNIQSITLLNTNPNSNKTVIIYAGDNNRFLTVNGSYSKYYKTIPAYSDTLTFVNTGINSWPDNLNGYTFIAINAGSEFLVTV